jgi:hypothetical protein
VSSTNATTPPNPLNEIPQATTPYTKFWSRKGPRSGLTWWREPDSHGTLFSARDAQHGRRRILPGGSIGVCRVHQSQAWFIPYVMTCMDVVRTVTSERVTSLPDCGPGVRQAVRHPPSGRAHASSPCPGHCPARELRRGRSTGEADQQSTTPETVAFSDPDGVSPVCLGGSLRNPSPGVYLGLLDLAVHGRCWDSGRYF